MRKSQFTEEQVVTLLRDAGRGEKPIEAPCGDRGTAAQTFYRWRQE